MSESKIALLYASPIGEYDWEYSINDLSKLRYIDKTKLKILIKEYVPLSLYEKIEEKVDRLYPILVDFQELSFECGEEIFGVVKKNTQTAVKHNKEIEKPFYERAKNFMEYFSRITKKKI